MAIKTFSFSVMDLRTRFRSDFAAAADTLGGAFAAGAGELPPVFSRKEEGLRMFRFRFENERTKECAAFIGQGFTVAEAWGDALKGTLETFRPKQDGARRPANGLAVLLVSGRIVSRLVEAFQSDETLAQEQARLAREAEAKRLAAGGRVA